MIQSILAGAILAMVQANVAVTPLSNAPANTPPSGGQEQGRTLGKVPSARRPDANIVAQYFPYRAVSAHVSGHVVLNCQVKSNGRLAHCKVIEESPKGWRFGDAALYASVWFQMKPETADGQPTAGAELSVPVDFDFPQKNPLRR